MPEFQFYVGSSEHWLGHWPIVIGTIGKQFPDKRFGVWNGEREHVGILTVEFNSDADAQRYAYALTVVTRNDCVLVVRRLDEFERNLSLRSVARYVVRKQYSTTGNRTLRAHPASNDDMGHQYVHDINGHYVAWLINSDATVSEVK